MPPATSTHSPYLRKPSTIRATPPMIISGPALSSITFPKRIENSQVSMVLDQLSLPGHLDQGLLGVSGAQPDHQGDRRGHPAPDRHRYVAEKVLDRIELLGGIPEIFENAAEGGADRRRDGDDDGDRLLIPGLPQRRGGGCRLILADGCRRCRRLL